MIRQPVWTLWEGGNLVPGTEPRFAGLSIITLVTALTELFAGIIACSQIFFINI